MKVVQSCLVGAVLVFAGMTAHADVRTTAYPGTICVALQDVAPNLYYSGNGTAYNDSTASYSVVCSATKQYFYDGSDDMLVSNAYWWAYVEDNNSAAGADATCYLRSCSQDHSSCVNSVSRSTSGTGTQVLDTTGVVFAAGSYTNHMMLRCTLPAKTAGGVRSGLHGFSAYEF